MLAMFWLRRSSVSSQKHQRVYCDNSFAIREDNERVHVQLGYFVRMVCQQPRDSDKTPHQGWKISRRAPSEAVETLCRPATLYHACGFFLRERGFGKHRIRFDF